MYNKFYEYLNTEDTKLKEELFEKVKEGEVREAMFIAAKIDAMRTIKFDLLSIYKKENGKQ